MTKLFVLWIGFVFATSSARDAFATELDAASTEALKQTQDLLRSEQQRSQYLSNHAQAKETDDRVKSLLGAQSGQAYELSAQIIEKLVRQTNGNAKELEQLVQMLQQNPESLKTYLDANQLDQIRSMASEVEKTQRPPAPR